MRIAYICADPGVPVFGSKGCSIHTQEILRTLLRHGHDVELFAARTGGRVSPGLERLRTHRLPCPPNGDPALRERAALAGNTSLHASLTRAGAFDMVYERYSLWSYSGMEFARKQGIPSVLEVNAPLIEEQGRYRNLVNRAAARDVAGRVFRASGALVAVSQGVAVYLDGFAETRGKVTVISNGVDPDRFDPPPPAQRPGVPLKIGFLGSLKPWHGVDVLLNAFARFQRGHPDSRIVLVGDGPERTRIEKLAETLQLSKKVKLTGTVPADQVPQLLADMDIAVAPYTDDRNFYFSPLKLFEYMAAGCAVLASRIGQVSEVINHGIDGLLCKPGDPNALACGMNRLAHDPVLRHRLGSAARAKVIRHYSWDHVVQRTLNAVQTSAVRQTKAVFA